MAVTEGADFRLPSDTVYAGRGEMVTDRQRKDTGKAGEDEACRFLLNMGHTILERNWRCGHLEIDIISLDADGIHFVEVKSRVFPAEAPPEESVGAAKRGRIAAAASRWIRKHGTGDMEYAFDVVSVVFKGDGYAVEYFPRAFIPIYGAL